MSATSPILAPLPWETRNLGLESFAVTHSFIEAPDEQQLKASIANVQKRHGDVFVQARCAVDTKTTQMLERCGFYFVESTVRPTTALSKYSVLDGFVADPSRVVPRRFNASDLEVVMASASNRELTAAIGRMAAESFVDDRFHVDHNCERHVADRRYALWVEDLLRDAAVRFDVLMRRSQPIAFMARRGGDLLLAGFTRTYATAGLGEFFWLRVLERLRADGVEHVTTLISLNNMAAVNLYTRLSFRFRDPQSTFHLWMRR